MSTHVWLCVYSVEAGILTCSRVAKVLVCPRTLLALREKTRHALLKEACWHGDKGRVEASVEHQTFPPVWGLFSSFTLLTLSTANLINKLTPLQLFSSHVSSRLFGILETADFYIQALCCCIRWVYESNQCPETINTALQLMTITSLFFLFPYTEKCHRRNVSTSLQRNCTRYGRLFESTPHTVWLLLLKVMYCICDQIPQFVHCKGLTDV